MKYRTLGRLGWKVSAIGFGAWGLSGEWGEQSEQDSVGALHRFLDLGGNFIDTAQVYGEGRSERVIGKVLKERKGDQRVYVATKIPPDDGMWPPSPYDRIEERFSEKYLRARIERSLRDLQVDCLDLLQLHTWTRAWNRNPAALQTLREFQKEGKIRAIGISTPEHDQDSLVELVRGGWLDTVQLIYNIFEQDAQAELLPAALSSNVGVIVRVAMDESSLTGKLTPQTKFSASDFRSRYFGGDRLERTVRRVEEVRKTVGADEPNLATAALKFALKPEAVSTVIPGIRNLQQADMNVAIGDQPPLSDALEGKLRAHIWRRGDWHSE